MNEQVRAFLDKAKNDKLISMGLIKEIKKEFGPYSLKYSKYDKETKGYYCDVPVAIDITDEEFEKLCKYAEMKPSPVDGKEDVEAGDVVMRNGAEKTLSAYNSVTLSINLLIAFVAIIAAFVIGLSEGYILIGAAILILIGAVLSWAVLKVFLNISNNLHEIKSLLKSKL